VPELAGRTRSVTVDGFPIAYHVFGSGRVIFAHPGGPGVEWSYLRMPEVERFATVVYIEPLGTGQSGRSKNRDDYSFEAYARAIDGVRAQLGVDKIVLLGHSHGGVVAQIYALAHPEHLRGLILFDTLADQSPETLQEMAANQASFEHEPWFAEASATPPRDPAMTAEDRATAGLRRELPFYVADWTGRSREFEPLRSLIHVFVVPAHAFDVRPRLGEIATPTLIVVGVRDFVCSPKQAQVLHAGIPGSRLVELDRSGHLGHLEQPVEFARAVHDFVATLGR
jgi:proline iminopeptidase